ncbi:MAG: 2-phospho-L-lactate guanylyltransferase [Actinomycetota bacterium]|nr:2-phospho-L-lactate guanylyltransferase [Actinomycetota bacterium]
MNGDDGVARAAPRSPGKRTLSPLLGPHAVLVPVKSFAQAKRRLTQELRDDDRRALVRRMAERVLSAAAPLPVAVVCDDREVADWARGRGALVLWEPGRGLNGAVQSGVAQLEAMGVRRVVVAHADLPLAQDLPVVARFDGITLVPDRRDDGTNVIGLPVGTGFSFSYGPGSFARHRAEAERLGLKVRVLREPTLSFDVDWPSDLADIGDGTSGRPSRSG